jgi:hypothetical protein
MPPHQRGKRSSVAPRDKTLQQMSIRVRTRSQRPQMTDNVR